MKQSPKKKKTSQKCQKDWDQHWQYVVEGMFQKIRIQENEIGGEDAHEYHKQTPSDYFQGSGKPIT
jgi:hypothetical protein